MWLLAVGQKRQFVPRGPHRLLECSHSVAAWLTSPGTSDSGGVEALGLFIT